MASQAIAAELEGGREEGEREQQTGWQLEKEMKKGEESLPTETTVQHAQNEDGVAVAVGAAG